MFHKRQKLDMQLKETEYFKKHFSKSSSNENSSFYRFYEVYFSPILKFINIALFNRATLGINTCTEPSAISKTNSGNGLIDEVIDLKMKLKEAQSLNEQLKLSFKKNLSELQNTLGECVEDKEKLMLKK